MDSFESTVLGVALQGARVEARTSSYHESAGKRRRGNSQSQDAIMLQSASKGAMSLSERSNADCSGFYLYGFSEQPFGLDFAPYLIWSGNI